tara:strand:+ start:520 stop:2343 length:1824 start_codon:yes stop_codon:yes gene_type:complete
MIDELEIAEGAYFYKKKTGKELSQTAIKKIFIDLSKEKMTRSHTIKEERISININGTVANLSICVFKKKFKPSFFKRFIEDEYEIKFCYILLLEYKDFIVVSKKNVASSSTLNTYLESIDYSTLSRLYAGEESKFHKLSLDNLDVSDLALRKKTVEALALESSFSTFGANNYAINNMRISSNGHLFSLSLNTARINRHSGKVNITDFCEWMADVCEDVNNFTASNSFIDSFALPVPFEERIKTLIPSGILFKLGIILESINDDSLVKVSTSIKGQEVDLELEKYIAKYDQVLDVFCIDNKFIAASNQHPYLFNFIGIELKILKKSIKIKSEVLKSIKLTFSDGEEISLEEYINNNNCFVVTFNDPKIAYNSKKLFENGQLLSNIDSFMSVFESCDELSDVESEKGRFTNSSENFSSCSIFNKVENTVNSCAPYMFLDDLGNEWADHIAVSDGVIEFYHSKHGNEGLSASKFQDVVGQAQKNLGNFVPPVHRIDTKKQKWNKKFKIKDSNNQSVQTNISRIRRAPEGRSIDECLDFYKAQLLKPNLRKVVYLVVNFISKSRLYDNLIALRDGEAVERKNEIIQILWFISSLISSCKEQGTEVKIICLD